jgi:acyl-CoA dehydrogenase
MSPWNDDDDVRMFRDAVRQFIEDEFTPHQGRWREQHRPDADSWTKAGAMGMLLPDIPDEYGGGGGSYAYQAVVLEELARVGVHFGVREQSIVARYLLHYGTEEQKQEWLPRMARGELVGAIAMTEPQAGSDLMAMATTARRDGDAYVLNGSKTFITNGQCANIICLACKTDPKAGPKGISLVFVVEPQKQAGYTVGRSLEKLGLHGQDTCELFFDGVQVPAKHLVGASEGVGLAQMMEQLPYERLMIATAATATMERAVAITSAYVKDRQVFGKRLIDFQNARFTLAECATGAHVARVFLDSCIDRFIGGELDPVTAAMAKYWLTESQFRIVDDCLQLHGGYGYMVEYPIARMWADCRMQRIGGGTNEIMREMIGWAL